MTMTWIDLLPAVDGDPVRGLPWQYQTAEGTARQVAETTDDAATEFASVKSSSDLGELRGATADQIVDVIEQIDGSFAELPGVFQTLESIFDAHQRRLIDLCEATRTALAVATTRWHAVNDARDHESERRAALQRVQNQVWSLRQYASSEADLTALELAEQRRRDRSWQVTVATNARTTAEANLAASRTDWQRLRDDEDELIQSTVESLKGVDIGDLKDPNALMSFLSGVASWGANLATDMWTAAAGVVAALADGRWLDALHHLSDLLGAVLEIAAIIALGVAIFATGGLLAGAIPMILIGLGALKLATDSVLAGTQHPHPVTGRPKSWTDVAVDAAVLAVTVATHGAGSKLGVRATGLQGEVKRSVVGNVRQIIRPVSGTGGTLYGAARTSTIIRSQREIATVLISEGFDEVRDRGLDIAGDAVSQRVSPGRAITTDVTAWQHPSIVDHARTAPAAAAGRVRIDSQLGTIRSGSYVAPTTSIDPSNYQLVGCPS